MITGVAESASGHLPLTAMDVSGRIEGLLYTLSIQQTYENQFEQPLEVIYIFPLPPRAAVAGYRLQVGDRKIEGQLHKRIEARKAYDRAIQQGHCASIAEQERADVFTVRAGNIAPGERLEVRLELEGPLSLEGRGAYFRLPLVVGERYFPGVPLQGKQVGRGVQLDSTAVPDASRLSPPRLLPGHPNLVRFSLTLDVDPTDLKFNRLECSLHEVEFQPNDRGGYCVVLGEAERLDRDFILRLHLEPGGLRSRLLLGADSTFMLTIDPGDAQLPPKGRDVVLVIDRSGSMQGWKMKAARRAAMRIVESLTYKDRIGLVRFDTSAETFRPTMQSAHDEAKVQALEFLRQTEVAGGTEMLAALQACTPLLATCEGERSLILITDGEIGDQDRVVRWASENKGFRIFTIAIGPIPGLAVLDRLASQSGGSCQVVESELRLESVLADLHHRVSQPVLLDVKLSNAQEQTPRRWDVFPGQPAVFFGRFQKPGLSSFLKSILKRGSIEVRAKDAQGRAYKEKVAAHAGNSTQVCRAWARSRILDLEDDFAGGVPETREIEELSLRFGVLSRFTAFLAVDEQKQLLQEPLHRVVQPVESSRKPESVVQLMQVDPLSISVGHGLLKLLDPQAGAVLLNELPRLRGQIFTRLGVWMPGVRLRDDPNLAPLAYEIRVRDQVVAEGELGAELNPKEILARLARVVLENAHVLVTRSDLADLVPKSGKGIAMGDLMNAVRLLLRQQIRIHPMEPLLQCFQATQDVAEMRSQLDLFSNFLDPEGSLPVIELSDGVDLDETLVKALLVLHWAPPILTSLQPDPSWPSWLAVRAPHEVPQGMEVRVVVRVAPDLSLSGDGASEPLPWPAPEKLPYLRDRVTLCLEGQIAMLEQRKVSATV